MKQFVKGIIICIFLALGANTTNAQLTQAFLMKDAIQNARKVATDSGWVNPKLVAIATIGDTAGIGQASALLGGGFDLKTGKSTLWVYVISAEDTQGNPQTKLVAYIKIGIGPFAQLQQVPLPADAVPGDVPFTPQDTIPVASVLNSDAIATKVSANTDYKTFAAANPKAKAQFITLFTTPFDIPESPFTQGTPLWNFNFANSADSNAPSLNCFVNAINGEVICSELGVMSINEHNQAQAIAVSPNPASNGVQAMVTLSEQQFHPSGVMTIVNLLGETVYSIHANISPAQNILIPSLPIGSYFIRYSSPNGVSLTPFIQQ